MKTKIICIVGPTASGKTALGAELAVQLNAEIISADSMQVYKNMPIATAVASEEEKRGIPHHLVEFLNCDESFSVADFVNLAKQKIDDISSRGKVAIIVGGTGLFIDSLVKNIKFSDVGVDDEIRETLKAKTTDELYDELKSVDEKAAKEIHKNNRKRVIRALELYYGGISKTQQNDESMLQENPYEALYIGINYKDRSVLYDRINRRVDNMIENGLVEESKNALENATGTSKQAIGHKELAPYFKGEISFDEAVDNLKKETRHYAKRQLTWFRKNKNIIWFYPDETDMDTLIKNAAQTAKNFLKGQNDEKAEKR